MSRIEVIGPFFDDLSAAVVAGVPIEDPTSASQLTQSRLAKLRTQYASGDRSTMPGRLNAALETWSRTGSMLPVLEGLSTRLRSRERIGHMLRWTCTYLTIVTAIGCLGLAWFSYSVVPSVEKLRAQPSINTVKDLEESGWATSRMPIMASIVFAGMLVVLIGFQRGGGQAIAMWAGGNQYVRSRVSANAMSTAMTLFTAGMSTDQAIATSCDLTAADSELREELIRLAWDAPHSQRLMDNRVIVGMQAANQRLAWMTVFVPISLVAFLGGALALLYGVTIFGTVIGMLRDLAATGF